jgi:hypothetical protein
MQVTSMSPKRTVETHSPCQVFQLNFQFINLVMNGVVLGIDCCQRLCSKENFGLLPIAVLLHALELYFNL